MLLPPPKTTEKLAAIKPPTTIPPVFVVLIRQHLWSSSEGSSLVALAPCSSRCSTRLSGRRELQPGSTLASTRLHRLPHVRRLAGPPLRSRLAAARSTARAMRRPARFSAHPQAAGADSPSCLEAFAGSRNNLLRRTKAVPRRLPPRLYLRLRHDATTRRPPLANCIGCERNISPPHRARALRARAHSDGEYTPQKPSPRLTSRFCPSGLIFIEKLTEQRQLQWCSGWRNVRGPDGRADATTSFRRPLRPTKNTLL